MALPRRWWPLAILLLAGVVGIVGLAAWPLLTAHPRPDAQTWAHYQSECERVFAVLEADRQRLGRYPEQVSESSKGLLDALGPPWTYDSQDGGKAFVLKLNRYRVESSWASWYDSRKGEWYHDR